MISKAKRKRPHRHHFTELGIDVFESRHSDDFTMEMDEWDFHKLCTIVKGSGFIETKTAMLPIEANKLVYLPAHVPHRFLDRRGDALTLDMVCFYDRAFAGNAAALEVLSLFQHNFPPLFAFDLADNYGRLKIKNSFRSMLIEHLQRREGSDAALWCQLAELLIFLTRISKDQRSLPNSEPRAMAFAGSLYFINNNFYRPIKVEELATLANLSYRRYTEQFKRSTGKTVTQYLSEVRVEYAKRIMLETGDIVYAAFESGFGDLAHFYRVFKKTTGSTPKRYISDQRMQLAKAGAA